MAALSDSVMATDGTITNAATSGSSATFTAATSFEPWAIYRIAVTQGTYITFNGTAASSTAGEYWPAGQVEYRKVVPGSAVKYIQDTTAGRITFSPQV